MRKRLLALLLVLALCIGAAPAALAAESVQTLAYEEIGPRMRESNPNYLVLEETIASIEVLDYDKMKEDMRDDLNGIAKLQWVLSNANSGDGYTYGVMNQSYSSLRESFDALDDGDMQEDNAAIVRQLRDVQNQMLLSAQTLYVALLEMRSGDEQLRRELAAMDRTVAEMELRYQRGQISDLQLTQVKAGRDQMKSAQATLERNIRLYTVQLQALVGMELTGELTLTEVPEISDEVIAKMDYATDLAAAKEVSYTLYSADQDLEDAKDDYLEKARQYGFNEKRYEYVAALHTYQAAQYTHAATIQSFEMNFMSAYTAVAEYRQTLTAAESALAAEKAECAAQELKYKQGKLSQNGLLDARDDLADAEAAVVTAKHDLFTAYLTYQQAVELGVLN